MKDMFLFSCNMDDNDALSYMTGNGDLNLYIKVRDHEIMTVQEFEKFKKIMAECAEIVLQATARRINQERSMEEVE